MFPSSWKSKEAVCLSGHQRDTVEDQQCCTLLFLKKYRYCNQAYLKDGLQPKDWLLGELLGLLPAKSRLRARGPHLALSKAQGSGWRQRDAGEALKITQDRSSSHRSGKEERTDRVAPPLASSKALSLVGIKSWFGVLVFVPDSLKNEKVTLMI